MAVLKSNLLLLSLALCLGSVESFLDGVQASMETSFNNKNLSDIAQVFEGCYAEENLQSAPDLSGFSTLLTSPDPEKCCSTCREKGWPFCGLFNGFQCNCGGSYGRYGPSSGCHLRMCRPFVCGGPEANSVYYSLPRSLEGQPYTLTYFSTPLSYKRARMTCISKDGDLASPINNNMVDSIAHVANASTTKIWVGMYRPQSADTYEWTEELLGLSYSSAEAELYPYWESGDKRDGGCVMMSTDSKRWSSGGCDDVRPFVCKLFTLPPQPTKDDNEGSTNGTAGNRNTTREADGGMGGGLDSQKSILVFIVVPAFLLCYTASCIAYCVHKIFRNCSERAMVARVSNYFEEERLARMFQSMKPAFKEFQEEENKSNFDFKNEGGHKSINKILMDKIRAKRGQDSITLI